MNKCMICGKDSGKGKTCSSTCRSKRNRGVAKAIASVPELTQVLQKPVASATVESKCCKASVTLAKELSKMAARSQDILIANCVRAYGLGAT